MVQTWANEVYGVLVMAYISKYCIPYVYIYTCNLTYLLFKNGGLRKNKAGLQRKRRMGPELGFRE
jgi:hypothetical protein